MAPEKFFQVVDDLSGGFAMDQVGGHACRGVVEDPGPVHHGIGFPQALDGLHHALLLRTGDGQGLDGHLGRVRQRPLQQELREFQQAFPPVFR